MSDRKNDKPPDEEPFLLTIVPFAGLGILLLLAVVWRVMPGSSATEEDVPSMSRAELAATVVAQWKQAPVRDIAIDPGRDFIVGPEDAPITLVEFSDFECPFCRTASNAAREILKNYDGKVRLVFKNFPLDVACNDMMGKPMHHNACRAAVLARCAGEQDQRLFWEVHDMLFQSSGLTPETLERVPGELDIALDELESCRDGGDALAMVREDIALGRSLGISGTPIFFANGRRLSSYYLESLKAVVEHILAED